MGVQNGWGMCSLCMGVIFKGHTFKGICPFGTLPGLNGQHKPDPSVNFLLNIEKGTRFGFQDKWRWCFRCEGLFFHGNQSDGVCPAGGPHRTKGSGEYLIQFASTPKVNVLNGGVAEFLWCAKCEGMYANFGSNFGTCPGVGDHSRQGSGNYFIVSV